MHFDDGIDSAGEHCEMRGIRDVAPPISLWLFDKDARLRMITICYRKDSQSSKKRSQRPLRESNSRLSVSDEK